MLFIISENDDHALTASVCVWGGGRGGGGEGQGCEKEGTGVNGLIIITNIIAPVRNAQKHFDRGQKRICLRTFIIYCSFDSPCFIL